MPRGLSLFIGLLKQSIHEILNNSKEYLWPLLAIIVISNLSLLIPLVGINEDTGLYMAVNFFFTLLIFFVISYIVFRQKQKRLGPDKLIYFVPTFLLYNLYYSGLFFLGLIFLVVPGFYALIFLSMAPFVAVFEPHCQEGSFRRSHNLVKQDILLVALISFINLFLELSSVLFDFIAHPQIKLTLSVLMTLPEAFVVVILTLVSINTYFHLRDLSLAAKPAN